MKKTRAIMIQGTGSGVGKSLIVAGLCRIFRDRGVNVAPFKAQNMALNSFVTREGGEIGRAQAFQAEAAGIEPCVDMNPILLKATGEAGCQVIVNGRVHSNMRAQEYYDFKKTAWAAVTRGFERLSKKHDLIVIEGAGSPAEINLSDAEVVNMSIARYAGAPVILVGDIDKGGVFASLYGTIALLNDDGDLIRAFIINKFRGDLAILEPGLEMIKEKTGRPVLGVLPYLGDLGLHEEDGVPLERLWWSGGGRSAGPKIKITVLRLRYISNFTDFDPFLYEADVDLVYSLRDEDIEHTDLVIIPGSKNTVQDLLFLRESGIEAGIKRAAAQGIPIIGICGGYQMLGKKLSDPFGIESNRREVQGIGLLEIETEFDRTKTTCQVEAEIRHGAWGRVQREDMNALRGYEIHMGRTTGDVGLFKIRRLNSSILLNGSDGSNSSNNSNGPHILLDGSVNKNCWGTYLHGIFDNDSFRRSLINDLRKNRGYNMVETITDYASARDRALNKWADGLKIRLDMEFIEELVKI